MTKAERTAGDNFLYQWLALATALLTLAGFIAYSEFQTYRNTGRQERERLRFQAEVVEKNIRPQLLLANRVIENIRKDLPSWQAQHDGFRQANQQLQVINDTLIGIRPILVIKADGTVIASSNATLIGMNFAQRDYFKTALQNPDPAILHVSAPFHTVLDTFVISLFRTIRGPAGEFAGIVIVSVVPEYFSSLLDSIRHVPDMRATIIHGDGKVFLSSPPVAGLDGTNLARPGSLFTRHLDSGLPANTLTGGYLTSSGERMMNLLTVRLSDPPMDKPLIVAVSRDLPAIYQPWLDRLRMQSMLYSVIAIFSVLGLSISHRRQRVQIAERGQAELKRLASEQQLRAFYELDLVGLTITSPEKGWLRINHYLCEMLEYSEEELRRMTWAELTHPADLAGDVAQFERLLANEINGYSLEKRFIAKSGRSVPANLVVRCIRKENGAVDYVTAMVEDITERKRAEEELRLAASVFTHAREGITITDAAGTIINVNDAFTRITGYSREEAVGQNPRILKSSRQDTEFYVALWRDLIAQGHWSGEIWNKRKSGEIYPEMIAITAVQDARQVTQQYVALFTDISERQRMEEQVRRLAFHDALTNLPNRRLFIDRLNQAMAAGKRSGCYGALMFLDLDDFKPLNDTHGHDLGDLLLIEAAERLRNCVREIDTVARFGGDEFVVMLSELETDREKSAQETAAVAEKIRGSLSRPYRLPVTCEGKAGVVIEHHCTASIGAVLFRGHESRQEDLLKWADAAMYQAKQAGRNSIRFHL